MTKTKAVFSLLVFLISACFSNGAHADDPLDFTYPYGYPYRAYNMVKAFSNDALDGWPAVNVLDGNAATVYSSKSFGTASNSRGAYIQAYTTGLQPVNEIVISPRMLNGQPMGFPQEYQIYFDQANGAGWTLIGTYSYQPDPNGNLLIDLSKTYMARGVKVLPTKLGVDNNNIYYFQIADLSIGYAPVTTNGALTCWIPGISLSVPTDTLNIRDKDIASGIGVTNQIGGVGTNFVISHNDQTVDILSHGSVGGAGWPTTYYTTDDDGTMTAYNQGGGNADQMWGVHANLQSSASNPIFIDSFAKMFPSITLQQLLTPQPQSYDDQTQELRQQNWTPLYSDHRGNGDTQTGTTPCDARTGATINDDGQVYIGGKLLHAGNQEYIEWQNDYSYRARRKETFPQWNAEQALYLDRAIARQYNMRIYLVAQGQAWTEAMDPVDISTFTSFSPPTEDGACVQSNCGGCNASTGSCGAHTANLDYAVLVYTIGGEDVGIAIHRTDGQPMQAQINLETETSCTNGSDECGDINFHTWLSKDAFNPVGATYKKGQVRSYGVAYDIGTLPELRAAGYGWIAPFKTQ